MQPRATALLARLQGARSQSSASPAIGEAYVASAVKLTLQVDHSLQTAHFPSFSEDTREGILIHTPARRGIERDGIATGRRIAGRHLAHQLELLVVHPEARQRVRDADLVPQRQHPVQEGIEAGLQPEVGGEPRDLVLDRGVG